MQLSKMHFLFVCTYMHKMAWSFAHPGQLISPGCTVLHLKSPWPWSPGRAILLACGQPFLCVRANISTMFLAGGDIDEPMPLPNCFSSSFSTKRWFISSRKDADQRNLALFENPASQCNGARQFSPEHNVTNTYDCS